jgi:hypothetical protein
VTAETITPNDDAVTPCDNYGAVSSRAEPFCDHQRQLDHLDTMLHDIKRVLDQIEPFLPMLTSRAKMLDVGAAMRRNSKRAKPDG